MLRENNITPITDGHICICCHANHRVILIMVHMAYLIYIGCYRNLICHCAIRNQKVVVKLTNCLVVNFLNIL